MSSCPQCRQPVSSPRPVLCPRCGFPLIRAEENESGSGDIGDGVRGPTGPPVPTAPNSEPETPKGPPLPKPQPPRRSLKVPWSIVLVPIAVVLTMVMTSTPQLVNVPGVPQPTPVPPPGAPPVPGAPPAPGTADCPESKLNVDQGLTPDAVLVVRCVRHQFPQIRQYGGVGPRPANVDDDHQTGRAVDIMIPGRCDQLGQQVIDYLHAQQKPLGVKYLIWCDQIWSVRRNKEGWRRYGNPNGSNDTLAHRDHVHVSVFGNGAGGPMVTMPPPPRLPPAPPPTAPQPRVSTREDPPHTTRTPRRTVSVSRSPEVTETATVSPSAGPDSPASADPDSSVSPDTPPPGSNGSSTTEQDPIEGPSPTASPLMKPKR